MKRSNAPIFWSLFGAGGMLSALIGPALVAVVKDEELARGVDLILVLGGDGSILHALQRHPRLDSHGAARNIHRGVSVAGRASPQLGAALDEWLAWIESRPTFILGDGYTAAELPKFEKDARRLTEILFSTSPFKEHRGDFNVWALCPASPESGISRPSSGIHHRNPAGSTYDAFGSERYVLTFENRRFRDIASFAPYDFVEILVNGATYGGGGIFNLYSTVAADSLWSPYVFVHEFGHHFAAIAGAGPLLGPVLAAQFGFLPGFLWLVIGAVLARHAADSPEAGLEAFNQALVALAEADLDGLDVRVHQHQVEDQVRKGHAAQGDAQAAHVGEVGLRRFARFVDLRKDHLAARAVLSPPRGDLTMQRAQLTSLVTTRVQFVQ